MKNPKQRLEDRAKILCSSVRVRLLLSALAVILLTLATLVQRPQPLLVWNVSASAPIGLYFVQRGGGLKRGDMAVVRLPQGFRIFAARRSYLPMNVPLVKRTAAARGDLVCANQGAITVNGRHAAIRRAIDARDREMPWWTGCRRLGAGEFFFLMTESPASFDGRYFGVSAADDVIGKGILLWRR